MKITIDKGRILHLAALLTFTHLIGHFLMNWYGWTFVSAYALSCSITCQLSNVAMQVLEGKGSLGLFGLFEEGGAGAGASAGAGAGGIHTPESKKKNRKKKKKT